MAHSVMSRLDTILYRNKLTSDNTQVPFAGAQVEFYRQGATIQTGATLNPGVPTNVIVYDPGEIKVDDRLEAGLGGAILSVFSPPTPSPSGFPGTTLTLVNTGSTAVTLLPPTRLILTNRRPDIYRDPAAITSIGHSLFSDANGRIAAYIPLQRFDYIIRPIGALVSTTGTVIEGSQLSWYHPGHALQVMVAVGISWGVVEEGEYIASVTYGGVPMVRIGGTDSVDMWRLVSPPAGNQQIVVTFSPGSSVVNAVGGSTSFSNVDTTLAFTPQIATGTDTSPSVTIPSTSLSSLIFDTLGVRDLSTAVTAGALAPQVEQWDLAVGVASNILRGAASTRGGASGTSTKIGWTLSGSGAWTLVGIELEPLSALPAPRLVVDAEGGTRPNPAWVNARDFPTLADALASIPATGGELYIPAGTYKLASTLTINTRGVTLRGDGPCTILEPTAPGAWPLIKLVAGADHCRICDLLLDGRAFGAGGASVLVIQGSPPQLNPPIPTKLVTSTQLENLTVQNAANYGMELRWVDILHATNCEFVLGKSGVLIDGTGEEGQVLLARFLGCQISSNLEYGVRADGNVTSLDFNLCAIAGNSGPAVGAPACGAYLTLWEGGETGGIPHVGFHGCHFEYNGLPHGSPAFIHLHNAPGTVVDGCWFNAQDLVDRAVVVDVGSNGTRVSNCMGWLLPVALAAFYAPGVQFANREIEPTGPARILGSSGGYYFGLDPVSGATPPAGSQNAGVAFLYSYASADLPPASNYPQGTMVWVDNMEIRVSNGANWRKVTLDLPS